MAECVGLKLGNYRLLKLLGHGGFGEVYLGEHVYLKTPAAIKVLQIQLGKNTLDAFLKEAQTIAHLEHPHIVRVLEFGMEGPTPFLVMNYAPHGTLRQHYPTGTCIPPATIVQFVKQVASALQYAHDRKIIHRDIKPENMLVGRNNEVLLSDFGLAVVVHKTQELHPAEHAGTTCYTAPEQLRGYPCLASDQYALGVVVYEWLCGSLPFQGSDREIAVQHAQFLLPALTERLPDLPPVVEQVVMRALEKLPQKRFASVQDFANALEMVCIPRFAGLTVSPTINPQGTQLRPFRQWVASTTVTGSSSTSAPSMPTFPVRKPHTTSGQEEHGLRFQAQEYSLPSPVEMQATRPFPGHFPATPRPRRNTPRPTRRMVLAGFLGVAMAAAGGTMLWELISQQGVAPASSPDSRATSIPQASQTPTVSQGATQVIAAFTISITDIPAHIHKNDTVNVAVHTSEPGVTVVLNAVFTPSGDTYTSSAQVTDGNGNATLLWSVHEPHAKGTPIASVYITGEDQKGQTAKSATQQVQVD